jgi:SSS family solute:Na+ symporter
MVFLYSSTIIWGTLGTIVALLLIRVTSALDAWWTLSGIFGGGMLGLFLLGILCKRAGNAAAILGVLVGIVIIGVLSIYPEKTGRIHTFLIPVFGTAVILIGGVIAADFFHVKTNKNT